MEILVLLFLIVLNGAFAMSEIAVVSARKARLRQRAEAGSRGAGAALELAADPGRFLSTIQVGITLIGIASGAFGEALLADPLAAQIGRVEALAPYAHGIALVVVIGMITYVSLIIGELVPKRLALLEAERIAVLVALPMRWLAQAAAPAVRLLSASCDLVLRLARVRPSAEPPVTEEEITALVEEGARAGVIEHAERQMVRNVFRLGELKVGAIMTPRLDIEYLDLEDGAESNRSLVLQSAHSRFPVCRHGVDNVQGVVQAKRLLGQCLAGRPPDIAAAMEPAQFVPESLSAAALLELFRTSRVHLALVVDEYGDLQGLVTMNDVLEALVGEIPSAGTPEELLAVQREDGSWLLDGMLPVQRFKELFGVKELPGEEDGSYHTIGGFVMAQLGRVPGVADHFDWAGFRFEVVDMDRNRVDQVLLVPPPSAEPYVDR